MSKKPVCKLIFAIFRTSHVNEFNHSGVAKREAEKNPRHRSPLFCEIRSKSDDGVANNLAFLQNWRYRANFDLWLGMRYTIILCSHRVGNHFLVCQLLSGALIIISHFGPFFNICHSNLSDSKLREFTVITRVHFIVFSKGSRYIWKTGLFVTSLLSKGKKYLF